METIRRITPDTGEEDSVTLDYAVARIADYSNLGPREVKRRLLDLGEEFATGGYIYVATPHK